MIAALDQFLWLLAHLDTVFGNGLIEGHRRASSAVGNEHNLIDADYIAQILNTLLDNKRIVFPWRTLGFVIFTYGIHG